MVSRSPEPRCRREGLGATIGAELTGRDLAGELPDETIAEIRDALHAYKVIFFRDQPVTPAQHVAFARRFGELEVHLFIPANHDEPELVRAALAPGRPPLAS